MAILSDGDLIEGSIDRISNSGNRIIELPSDRINVGPIKKGNVGKIVEAVMIDGHFAFCLTDSVRAEDYNEKFKEIVGEKNIESKIPTQDTFPVEEKEKKHVGRKPLQFTRREGDSKYSGKPNFCDDCGSIMKKENSEWVCRKCGWKEDVKESGSSGNSNSEIHPKSADDPESDRTQTTADNTTQTGSDGSVELTDGKSLDELRKKAQSEAVSEVPNNATTSTKSKPEYTRSQAIVDYVKNRANGVCEGCEEPAPFTSKTGDPYLHAHHVHELSEGGSDTPDTVIALCPNCHYRVHHGEDGDDFNQILINKLEKIE